MKTKEFWIRVACWAGAVADAVAALMLMFPGFNSFMTGLSAIPDNALYRSTNGIATALMWGWTVLLVWTAQKPMERRGVLVITLFPVLTWLMSDRIIGLIAGQLNPAKSIPLGIIQVILFGLFAFSLWNAQRPDSDKKGY